jgi:hypothetical protein
MEEDKQDFNSLIREVIISKLNLIELLVDQKYLVGAEQVVDEITDACNALSHYIRSERLNENEILPENDQYKNKINPLIKTAQRHLGRLEDYVYISDGKNIAIETQKLSDVMEELKKSIKNKGSH